MSFSKNITYISPYVIYLKDYETKIAGKTYDTKKDTIFKKKIPQTAETSGCFQNRIPIVNEKPLKIAQRPPYSTENLTEVKPHRDVL